MDYKKIEVDGYDLHLLKTTRFKTVTLEINFINAIKKEDITKSSLLTKILSFSCNKYPTKKELQIKKEELYGLSINNSSYRVGNYLNFDFDMSFLEEEFSDKNILDDSLELLREMVYHPLKEGEGFNSNIFNIAKNIQRSIIDSEEENKSAVSMFKMLEKYDGESPVSYRKNGYIEDLDSITSVSLFKYYEELLKTSNVNIFVVGNIDFDEVENKIKKNFYFTKNKLNIDGFLEEKKPRTTYQEIIEKDDTNQAKLSIGCTVNGLTKYENDYVLSIYNLILGGTADSRFFKNIREKHSLCYSISSGSNRIDNFLVLRAGVAKENYKKMFSLIKREMNIMKKELISNSDLESALKYASSGVDSIFDNPNRIINYYYMVAMLGMEPLEVRKKKINEVSKEDINSIAKKITIDTVYLLGGDTK